jgi:hypothetical protein
MVKNKKKIMMKIKSKEEEDEMIENNELKSDKTKNECRVSKMVKVKLSLCLTKHQP